MTLPLFLFLLNANCYSPAQDLSVEKTEKYGTGAIARRYQEINGEKVGKMTDYYPEGQIKAERWFEHNQQTGRTVLFYPSGKTKEVQYYQNGKKEGGDTLYYENGRAEFALWYRKEKKNGYLRKWDPEGKLVVEARYAMDSLVEVNRQKVQTNYPALLKGPTGAPER